MKTSAIALAVCASIALPCAAQGTVESADLPLFDAEHSARLRSARRAAADLLESALDRQASRDELARTAGHASAVLERGRMHALLSEMAANPPVIGDLERGVERVISDLRFEVIEEAPLPAGWPTHAPVGEVVLKQYPSYRVARTGMHRTGMSSSFMTLFDHIQRNDIAMTAPVEMSYEDNGPRARGTEMGFLYRRPDMGENGSDGNVDVVDVPPTLALSIGARGRSTTARCAELASILEEWLTQHADSLEATGPMRVMAHNGPSVFGNRAFFEVEIPVRRLEPSDSRVYVF